VNVIAASKDLEAIVDPCEWRLDQCHYRLDKSTCNIWICTSSRTV